MKKLFFCILILCSLSVNAEPQNNKHRHLFSFLKPFGQHLRSIWVDGDTDLYLSGYAWHNRYTYTSERIKLYNELAWGGGLGKGIFTPKGNWGGLYVLGFLDSHRNFEPAAGYAFLKMVHFDNNIKAGLGYSVLVTSRVDLYNGIPFPGVVPWASIFYKKVSIAATYIPGAIGAGNVLYIVGKYTF